MSGSSPTPPAVPVQAVVPPVLSIANLTHSSSLLGYAVLVLPVLEAIGAAPVPTTSAGWIAIGFQAVLAIAAVLKPSLAAKAPGG